MSFFAVSGLTYVADFAKWWAEQQMPKHKASKAYLEASGLGSFFGFGGLVWV